MNILKKSYSLEFYNIDLINVIRIFKIWRKISDILKKSYSLEFYDNDLINVIRDLSKYAEKTLHILKKSYSLEI